MEESFYLKNFVFLWSIKIFAAWNIIVWTLERVGRWFLQNSPHHSWIHLYPLPHCLPCVWHYTKCQGYNDDKTEIISILVDHRIYWESKNETNNYKISYVSKICWAYPQHRDFELVIWNTLVQISTIVLSSTNSGHHHSTTTFSIKPSLTIPYKNGRLPTPTFPITFPDVLTFL